MLLWVHFFHSIFQFQKETMQLQMFLPLVIIIQYTCKSLKFLLKYKVCKINSFKNIFSHIWSWESTVPCLNFLYLSKLFRKHLNNTVTRQQFLGNLKPNFDRYPTLLLPTLPYSPEQESMIYYQNSHSNLASKCNWRSAWTSDPNCFVKMRIAVSGPHFLTWRATRADSIKIIISEDTAWAHGLVHCLLQHWEHLACGHKS